MSDHEDWTFREQSLVQLGHTRAQLICSLELAHVALAHCRLDTKHRGIAGTCCAAEYASHVALHLALRWIRSGSQRRQSAALPNQTTVMRHYVAIYSRWVASRASMTCVLLSPLTCCSEALQGSALAALSSCRQPDSQRFRKPRASSDAQAHQHVNRVVKLFVSFDLVVGNANVRNSHRDQHLAQQPTSNRRSPASYRQTLRTHQIRWLTLLVSMRYSRKCLLGCARATARPVRPCTWRRDASQRGAAE